MDGTDATTTPRRRWMRALTGLLAGVIAGTTVLLGEASAAGTRPNAPGRQNVGWLNAHFVNDGLNTNQVDPGVPAC